MNLESLKGVGDQTLKLLTKLNISTIQELLEYYPYRYEFIHVVRLQDCVENQGMVNAQVIENPKVMFFKKNLNRLTFRCMCDGKIINVTIFNRSFLKNKLIPAKLITLVGKYNPKTNTFTASDIKLDMVTTNSIEPVYHLVSGVTNKQINTIITNALTSPFDLDDYIPNYLNEKYQLMPKEEAVRQIHMPTNAALIKKAKLKLIYEEFFIFMFKMNYLKRERELHNQGIKRELTKEDLENIINSLPFTLTKDQLSTINDIYNDFIAPKRMNRLVLGDVGSGKTIVSIVAMALNKLSNYQSALMAPTEVLALQHYETIKKILPQVNVGCLVGSMTKTAKKKTIQGLIDGTIDILVGTHAILSENVTFKNLGLVITDEQHRFGVNQRNIIQNKGTMVDVIYMSATPIPRTYALALYGDMDLSMIKTKPSGRKEIITKVVSEKNIKEVLESAWQELKNGHQIYCIAPLIQNEDEESNLNDVYKLEENFNKAFNHKVPIGILHGKMKKNEKNEVMASYASGKYRILISTTVIEVGVDVKNSTMIIIYNAERFGLATLHQLRGRVGRNDIQSYCYLIANADIPRLQVLESSNDGFYISEKDFELRGEGDLFGIKQSGDMKFKLGDINRDKKILLQCKNDSYDYLENFDNNPLYLRIIDDIKFHN